MRKIKNVVILVCLVILTACNSSKNGYVVNGVIPDGVIYGKFVHMLDFNNGIIIDSVKVINGKFSFKGDVVEPKAVRLSIDRLYANVILEKGVITVDMSDPKSAKGTPLIEKYNEFISETENLVKKAGEKLTNIDKSLTEDEIYKLQEVIVEKLFEQIDELPVPYLKNHPNDILGAMIFYTWMQNQMEPSVVKFNEYSKLVGEKVLNFGPVKQMAEYYNSMGNAIIGTPFIDFTIEKGNRDGSPASLSDYVGKGKYVLVAFWASWCVPCRNEATYIAQIYNKYKGDKFDAVSVAVLDKREATLQAIERNGFTWPQIIDAKTIPTELYGINSIPYILLFGPDGNVVASDLRGNNMIKKVTEVMRN